MVSIPQLTPLPSKQSLKRVITTHQAEEEGADDQRGCVNLLRKPGVNEIM